MLVKAGDLAELFDCSERSVRNYASAGMPKEGHGQYPLKKCLEWWLQNVYGANDTPDIQAEKTKYWAAKARVEAVKADEAEKSVVSMQEVTDSWAWRICEMRDGLLALPLRLAPLVSGKSELETRKILTDQLWTILDKYSRTGRWTPDNEDARKIRNRETVGKLVTDTGGE